MKGHIQSNEDLINQKYENIIDKCNTYIDQNLYLRNVTEDDLLYIFEKIRTNNSKNKLSICNTFINADNLYNILDMCEYYINYTEKLSFEYFDINKIQKVKEYYGFRIDIGYIDVDSNKIKLEDINNTLIYILGTKQIINNKKFVKGIEYNRRNQINLSFTNKEHTDYKKYQFERNLYFYGDICLYLIIIYIMYKIGKKKIK